MEASVADHAWSHAVAVLGAGGAAEAAAVEAVARGGRHLPSVLAHARHQSLVRAVRPGASDSGFDPGTTGPDLDAVPGDVTALALALVATRPPEERAVLDIDGRHGVDRPAAALALGLAPAAVGERVAAIAEAWDRALDPAVLAWFGPGECSGLAAVVESGGGPVGRLLEAAPAVAEHASGCEACADRLRAMVSARGLWAQQALLPAPDAVAEAARRARPRRPAPLPPPLDSRPDPEPSPPAPRRIPAWVRPAVSAAAALALVVVVVVARRGGDGRGKRVADLTRLPQAGTALALSPTQLTTPSGTLLLTNTSSRTLQWTGSANQPWVGLRPQGGRLSAGDTVVLTVEAADAAPEGDDAATVTLTADEGSVATATLKVTIEHPPALTATIAGCAVTATADDESGLASVAIEATRPPVFGQRPPPLEGRMTAQPDGTFTGDLPADTPIDEWRVVAIDRRGNTARSPFRSAPTCRA